MASAWSLEKAVLESLSTPLLVVARDGTVRLGNGAAGLFWRQPPEKLPGQSVRRLFNGDARILAAVERAVDAEASSTIEAFPLDQGASLPPLSLRVQVDPVSVPGQPVNLALIALWDETQREQLEAVAREQRLLHSMNLMLRGLAHELHNPLSGIKGATQLLARRLAKSTDQAEYPVVILKELDRMERLIKNLLSHGGEPPLNRTVFNLHELLDEVLWFVANSTAAVTLERDYDPSLPEIHADRDRTHQVFLNLIRNAVEASPPGGVVRVRTGMIGPWQEGGALPDPARIYFSIEVEDQGPGIPPEARERLFTPFYTTKKSGSGLGLFICRQIVWAHEGYLRYRPLEPHGSVFAVIIPMLER